MDTMKLQGLSFELSSLADTVEIHRSRNDYVYADTYRAWVVQYNNLIDKYNALTGLAINKMVFNQYDLSSTKKTVRDTSLEAYVSTIKELCKIIGNDIEAHNKQSQTDTIPHFQMRRCFKLGMDRCPLNPPFNKNKVFIAMPFNDTNTDIAYQYGIIPALDGMGLAHYKADNEISNKDIMCKICYELQSCNLAIINISGLNPNVMLEQGLAYGLGKSVIIIKDKTTRQISDLGSIEYIEYEHPNDLAQKLMLVLRK